MIETAVQNDDFFIGERLLKEAENELAKVLASQTPKVAGVFQAKIADLRYGIVDSLADCWRTLVHVNPTGLTISVNDQIQRRPSTFLTGFLLTGQEDLPSSTSIPS